MKFLKCHSTYPLRERRPGAQLALSLDGSLVKEKKNEDTHKEWILE